MLKRLLRHPAVLAAFAAALGRYLDFALRTTRWTLHGAEHADAHLAGAPAVAAFWHERLPLMPAMWFMAQARTPGLRMNVLVSRHADGRFIALLLRRFGLATVHGSTARNGQDRGGATGLRQMLELLAAGELVAVTPDGPRGPRRLAAPGVAQIAALSGQPVLACAAQTSRRHTLKTWDRMVLPLPFGRGVVVCQPVIHVAREDAEAALPLIAAALDAAADAADQLCPR